MEEIWDVSIVISSHKIHVTCTIRAYHHDGFGWISTSIRYFSIAEKDRGVYDYYDSDCTGDYYDNSSLAAGYLSANYMSIQIITSSASTSSD
eukprot:gene10578-14171_t